VRVDKQRWSVMIGSFNDLGGAEKMYEIMEAQSRRLVNFKNEEIYIMTDQYGGDIVFHVFYGNFVTKEVAEKEKTNLKRYGMEGKLRDFKTKY